MKQTKTFINNVLRWVYPAALILPVLHVVASGLQYLIPSASVLEFPPLFSYLIGTIVVVAIILSCPAKNSIVLHDGVLKKRDPLFALMGLPVTAMGYLLSLGFANDNPEASMASVVILFGGLLAAMMLGMALEIYLQVKCGPDYRAAKRAEADIELAKKIDALVVTLPQSIRADIATQLNGATYQEVEEVAAALQTLQDRAPQLLVQK